MKVIVNGIYISLRSVIPVRTAFKKFVIDNHIEKVI